MKLRTLSALLVILFTLSCLTLIPVSAAKASPITKTVNLAEAKKNISGNGYTWANLDDILTLDGLNIKTSDEYGMKIPANATVILKGDNYISAERVGLVCPGQVTFEGDGTLTIVAGEIGIDCTSVQASELVRFREGTFTISAGKTGIKMEQSELSLMGSKITVSLTGSAADAKAVDGRTVTMSGGSFKANAGVFASNSLRITSMNAEITASGAALNCQKDLQLTKVAIKTGATSSALSSAEAYNGESAIKLTSTASNAKKGILFSGSYPIFVDYLIFFLILIVIAALIAVPIYLKKKKTEKLIAEYKAANPPKKKKTTPSATSAPKNTTSKRR